MLNIKWYVGQPIVYIQTHSQGIVKKGQEFVIKGIKSCKCNDINLDIGILAPSNALYATSCECGNRIIDKIHWFSQQLFAPLDVNISELTEILTKEFQEK